MQLQRRALDTLIDPEEPVPSHESHILPHLPDLHDILPDSSFFKKLDLRNAADVIPFLKDLKKRVAEPVAQQQAAAAAAVAADANGDGTADTQPAAGAVAGQAAQQPIAGAANPAVAAPVAGGGGGAGPAAAQPAPGAVANGVSVIEITTVVDGVTKVVPSTFSQDFAADRSAPPVQTGTIGLGTLTGRIGVVKTGHAKSEAMVGRENPGVRWHILGVIASWVLAMSAGGAFFGLGLI